MDQICQLVSKIGSHGVGREDDQLVTITGEGTLQCLPQYTQYDNWKYQLQHLRDDQQHLKAPPNVVYAQLKYMWANGSREESLSFLRQFSTSLARDLQVETKELSQRPGVNKHKLDELSRLLARCYFKQGQWQVELKEDWDAVSILCTVDINS